MHTVLEILYTAMLSKLLTDNSHRRVSLFGALLVVTVLRLYLESDCQRVFLRLLTFVVLFKLKL